MSEASRNWPDYGQVIDDNLQAREDERVQEHKKAAEESEPEEGADSDDDRVARARQRHEELAAENTEPGLMPVAEQKAAGVPDDQTVTIADQKAGVPAPDIAGPADDEE